jgi:lipid-A-disaccharide synthase
MTLEMWYPLGYISSLLFGLRFFIQWIQSEKAGKSVVTPLFWQLSLAGNIALFVHSLIQMQFHVAAIQSLNGVISWRNLDLMTPAPRTFRFTVALMGLSFAATLGYFVFYAAEWFAAPGNPMPIDGAWHLFGALGLFLFSFRFLVQWWHAEQDLESTLTPLFWTMSLLGGIFSLIYFIKLGDTVNLLGPALGLIPYIRNLMLIRKKRAA